MKTKTMAYQFNDDFINGSIVTDVDSFDGLKARCNLTSMSAQKLVSATSTNLITDSQANALAFIAEMDRLTYAIDGHTPTFMMTSDTGLLKINQALRMAGVLNQSKDQFGQLVTMWGPCPIYDIGVKYDQATKIMGDEDINGAAWASSNKYFSIYAVKIGEGTDFWGIQKHAMEVIDKGLLENVTTYRTNVNWPVGLSQINKRSIARLYGVRSS
jgi:hypothetical protein